MHSIIKFISGQKSILKTTLNQKDPHAGLYIQKMKALFAIGALVAICFAVVSAAPNYDDHKYMYAFVKGFRKAGNNLAMLQVKNLLNN